MAPDEGRHVGAPDELHVDGPRPAQHHHEGPDPVLAPVLSDIGEAAPVHLCLLAWRRLEPHRRTGLTRPTPRPHVVGQRRIAAVVAQLPDLPQQHHAVVHSRRQPTIYVTLVWVQLRPLLLSPLGLGHLVGAHVLAHGVPGNPQLPRYPSDRASIALQLV